MKKMAIHLSDGIARTAVMAVLPGNVPRVINKLIHRPPPALPLRVYHSGSVTWTPTAAGGPPRGAAAGG